MTGQVQYPTQPWYPEVNTKMSKVKTGKSEVVLCDCHFNAFKKSLTSKSCVTQITTSADASSSHGVTTQCFFPPVVYKSTSSPVCVQEQLTCITQWAGWEVFVLFGHELLWITATMKCALKNVWQDSHEIHGRGEVTCWCVCGGECNPYSGRHQDKDLHLVYKPWLKCVCVCKRVCYRSRKHEWGGERERWCNGHCVKHSYADYVPCRAQMHVSLVSILCKAVVPSVWVCVFVRLSLWRPICVMCKYSNIHQCWDKIRCYRFAAFFKVFLSLRIIQSSVPTVIGAWLQHILFHPHVPWGRAQFQSYPPTILALRASSVPQKEK